SAAVDVIASVLFGRWGDRAGPRAPLRACLACSTALLLLFPIVETRWALAVIVGLTVAAAGAFFAPAFALLANESDKRGLHQALGFALLNIAWAPASLIGAVASGATSSSLGGNVAYLVLALMCSCTLIASARFS